MARRVRYHISFQHDLADRVEWLHKNRPPVQRGNLRAALASFKTMIAANPRIGTEVEVRGTRSYRVFPVRPPLPYLVWYYYETADEKEPVWLVMLMHEAQDRERFDPDRFEN